MRLKTPPYHALEGLVHTTGSAGGYDSMAFKIAVGFTGLPHSTK